MSTKARSNARYAFFKDQMRKQGVTSNVGTAKWRKKHSFRVDEVAAMRQKYRREVMAAGEGVVPTPVRDDEGFRNRRTRYTKRANPGTEFDLKQIGTRLKRHMDEAEILHQDSPEDKQAEARARVARRAYMHHLDHVADLEFAATLPTAAPVSVEEFQKVV